MSSIKSSKLFVDGDEYLFKVTSVLEKEVRWDDNNHVLYSDAQEVWDTFQIMMRKLKERLGSEFVTICFSGVRPYFREALGPYKVARDGRKPLCYARVREKITLNYPTICIPGLEADDAMGIWSTATFGIIVSSDKDMKTVPGWLYNPHSGDMNLISKETAHYNHLLQTLTGDASDGYKGCPKMGPARAEKLLQEDCSWQAVKEAFEKQGLTEEDALTQARMAKILTSDLWDADKQEAILWTP